MARPRVALAKPEMWAAVRNQPGVHHHLWEMADRVRQRAEDWVQEKNHSHEHPPPNFEVRRSRGQTRARYSVHPTTPYATYWVTKDPAGFIACLEAAQRG